MTEDEKWELLMASIRKAARILGIELTEKDMPEYLNWFVGRKMNEELWGRVYSRDKFATRFRYELKKRGW